MNTLSTVVSLITNENVINYNGFEVDLFKPGVSAEIVVIDPDKKWRFTKQSVKSKSFNSPFFGKYLVGKVDLAISCGNVGTN